jgi:hypothetical protein
MELAKQNPETDLTILKTKMSDGKYTEKNGWRKAMKIFREINGIKLDTPIEIHYIIKTVPTKNDQGINVYEANHFKFKEYSPSNLGATITQQIFDGEKLDLN